MRRCSTQAAAGAVAALLALACAPAMAQERGSDAGAEGAADRGGEAAEETPAQLTLEAAFPVAHARLAEQLGLERREEPALVGVVADVELPPGRSREPGVYEPREGDRLTLIYALPERGRWFEVAWNRANPDGVVRELGSPVWGDGLIDEWFLLDSPALERAARSAGASPFHSFRLIYRRDVYADGPLAFFPDGVVLDAYTGRRVDQLPDYRDELRRALPPVGAAPIAPKGS